MGLFRIVWVVGFCGFFFGCVSVCVVFFMLISDNGLISIAVALNCLTFS